MPNYFHARYLKTDNLSAPLGVVNISGSGIPVSSGVFDLGSTLLPWQDLYVQGNVKIANQTISVYDNKLRVNDENIITTTNITGYITSGTAIGFDHAHYIANGSETTYNTSGVLESSNNLLVAIDGLLQRPSLDFILASNNIIFTSPPPANSIILIKNLKGTSSSALTDQSCAGLTYDRCDEMTLILMTSVFS